MRLRILFTLLTTLLVVTAIGFIIISSQISNTAFYIAEGFLTLCIGFSCYFYFLLLTSHLYFLLLLLLLFLLLFLAIISCYYFLLLFLAFIS